MEAEEAEGAEGADVRGGRLAARRVRVWRGPTGGRAGVPLTSPPPLECGVSTQGTKVQGGVMEGEGVKVGVRDGAGFGGVFPVEIRDSLWSEEVGVFHPLVMSGIVAFEPNKIPE